VSLSENLKLTYIALQIVKKHMKNVYTEFSAKQITDATRKEGKNA
jgi:hypothetical protein